MNEREAEKIVTALIHAEEYQNGYFYLSTTVHALLVKAVQAGALAKESRRARERLLTGRSDEVDRRPHETHDTASDEGWVEG